jgi:outer membrane protein assembly factor BamB
LNADNGSFIWSFPTGGKVVSSPTVSNGRVYIGSQDNKMYCLNADNGSFIWSFPTGGKVDSSPTVSNSRVYFGSADKNIYCLSADNGSLFWNHTTWGVIESSPVIFDERIFIGSGDNYVYCLYADNGSKIWKYGTRGNVDSSPAISNGRVFIGSGDKKIYCLNADNGSFIWSYKTDNRVDSSPTVANGSVFIGSYDNRVYCLDVEKGGFVSHLWNFNNFCVSNTRSYSGNCSFYTRLDTPEILGLMTAEPIPVTEGMDLSFWCWYEINPYDCTFIEVSLDGRNYDILDKFNGSSLGWVYKIYNLDDFVNKSIFIRFRSVSDSYKQSEGFYFDDIAPLSEFRSINTLSDSIENNYYEITGREEGIYYYRVKGINHAYGWGDFSTLKSIHVISGKNDFTVDGLSPINLKVTDADGRFINNTYSNIPDAVYIEEDLDGDGILDDRVFIPDAMDGLYNIEVNPESDADPTDTYSLKTSLKDMSYYLALDVMIKDIPPDGYNLSWPNKPLSPNGPDKGIVDKMYNYTSFTSDPDGDDVEYLFNWGDGTDSDWIETDKASHKWSNKGNFKIMVKARDVHGFESRWSEPLEITIPRNRLSLFNFYLLDWFLDRFPMLERLLTLFRMI